MKVQFKEKDEMSWDKFVEGVGSEEVEAELYLRYLPLISTTRERFQGRLCVRSWLTWLFIVSAVTLSQLCIFVYFFSQSDLTPVTHFSFTDKLGNLRHVHFSWKNCGSKSDPFKLEQLQISPDPVMLDGNITLTLNASLDRFLDAPISASVHVQRKWLWWWVNVPCLDDIGSCTYKDICALNPFTPSQPCPDPFPRFGIPCRCPFPKAQYKVKDGVFVLPAVISNLIPKWLVSGDYYILAKGMKDGHLLSCYSFYISISA